MVWMIGTAVVGLMSVACGINLGIRVAKGSERVWQPSIFGWAVGFHGAAGVLALYLLTQAR
jgi:hypothetical protein